MVNNKVKIHRSNKLIFSMIKFAKMSTISKIHAKLKPFLNLIKTLRKNSTHSSNKKFCDRYFYTYKTANPVKDNDRGIQTG